MHENDIYYTPFETENGIEYRVDTFYLRRYFDKKHSYIKERIDKLKIPHETFSYGGEGGIYYSIKKEDLMAINEPLIECEPQSQDQIAENCEVKA